MAKAPTLPTFETWMRMADAFCWEIADCSAWDLPLYPWRAAYDAGAGAQATAKRASRDIWLAKEMGG